MDTYWPPSPKAPLKDTLPGVAVIGKLPGKLYSIILVWLMLSIINRSF